MMRLSGIAVTGGLFFLSAVTAAGVHEFLLRPDGHLHLYVFDVGEGNSALVVTPAGHRIVIDGGPDDSALVELGRRLPFFDRTIDLLVLTSPRLEDVFSFPDIIRRYGVRQVLMTGSDVTLPREREFLLLLSQKHIAVTIASAGKEVAFDSGTVLCVLWPAAVSATRADIASVMVRLTYGAHSALFAGDSDLRIERKLLAAGTAVASTVLIVARHGSKASSGTGFLTAVHPQLAIISSGKNRYGYPDPDVLRRLAALRIPVRMTAQEGTIAVVE